MSKKNEEAKKIDDLLDTNLKNNRVLEGDKDPVKAAIKEVFKQGIIDEAGYVKRDNEVDSKIKDAVVKTAPKAKFGEQKRYTEIAKDVIRNMSEDDRKTLQATMLPKEKFKEVAPKSKGEQLKARAEAIGKGITALAKKAAGLPGKIKNLKNKDNSLSM